MQAFIHCVWPPEMTFSAAEKGGGEKKKSATSLGIPSETGCPNNSQVQRINQTLLVEALRVSCMTHRIGDGIWIYM